MRWMLVALLMLCPFLTGAGLVGTAVSNAPASGANASQIWFMSWDQAIATTAVTSYQIPYAPENGDIQADTTETSRQFPVPSAGVVSDLNCKLSGDLGAASDVLTFTIRKDAGDTAVVCTITAAGGTEDSCNSGANTATFAAGEKISMSIVTADTPAAVSPSCYLTWTPTTSDEFVIASSNPASTGTKYYYANGLSTNSATEANRASIMPVAGDITAIYVSSNSTYSGTMARTFTLMKNGGAEAGIACTLNSTNTTACSDTGTVAIALGDNISIREETTAGGDTEPTDVRGIALVINPTTAGEFPIIANSAGNASTTANRYSFISGGSNTWNGSETTMDGIAPAFTAYRIYMKLGAAASVGYAVSLRDDAGASSAALSCDTGATNACNATATANIGAGSMVNFLLDPGPSEGNATAGSTIGIGATYP